MNHHIDNPIDTLQPTCATTQLPHNTLIFVLNHPLSGQWSPEWEDLANKPRVEERHDEQRGS
eukprot:1380318-Amorphochlora_amoeboformis.AAC.2